MLLPLESTQTISDHISLRPGLSLFSAFVIGSILMSRLSALMAHLQANWVPGLPSQASGGCLSKRGDSWEGPSVSSLIVLPSGLGHESRNRERIPQRCGALTIFKGYHSDSSCHARIVRIRQTCLAECRGLKWQVNASSLSQSRNSSTMSSTPESPSPRLTESLDLKVSPKLPMLTFGSMPLTPPLTPPISLSPSKQSKPSSVKIHSPIDIASYPLPPDSYSHSLHIPLKAHLALAHPNTPPSVASFCARRLLSPEIPHGFESEWEWKPIHLQENGIDLQTAGVGKDATKELREGQNGPGKEADEKLEMMYGVARTSWRILESKVPTRNCAL